MKLISPALALLAFSALTNAAHAETYTWAGDTTLSAVWDRPDGNYGLSSYGYTTHYDVFQFTVSQSGTYVFQSTSTSNAYNGVLWDNYTFLYQDSFSPVKPDSLYSIDSDDDNGSRYQSGFEDGLTAGTQYYFITTGIDRVMYGRYSDTISGPGSILPAAAAAVPEPENYALLALGLLALATFAHRRRT